MPIRCRGFVWFLFYVPICLGLQAGIAQAQNSLNLDASPASVELGAQVQVVVTLDFTDATVGGGATLAYDHAILSLDSIVFDGGLGDDPDFQCPGSLAIPCPSDPDYVSFGTVAGLSGQSIVATATFTSIAMGTTTVSLQVADPFAEVGGGELSVAINETTVVSAAAVPALAPWAIVVLVSFLTVTARRIGSRSMARLLVSGASPLLLAAIAPPASAQDGDQDGILDALDNCMATHNPAQRDSNADGYGNRCDPDLDQDGDVDGVDLDQLKSVFFSSDPDADLDGDSTVDFLDLAIMAGLYGGAPGPTCLGCPLPAGTGAFWSVPPTPIPIPDDDPSGAVDSSVVETAATIVDLDVYLRVSHPSVGEITVILTHVETGTAVTLIDKPGAPAAGCAGADIDATLDDEASLPAEDECAADVPVIAGWFTPFESLDAFDGEDIGGTWSLTVIDASPGGTGVLEEWGLLANNPVSPPAVEMVAYRPQTEAYDAPLLRRAIPDVEEESPGAGVRINGDDDDGSSSADRDDTLVPGENDLIEVELVVDQVPPPTGIEYVLRRSNSSIKVWGGAAKGSAVLDGNDEAIISFTGMTETVWVESPNGGSAFLMLEARLSSAGPVLSSDRVHFFAFTSIVIGLHGEFQFPTDPPFGPNEGVSVLAVDLHKEGYDSHMYIENDVESDGSGPVYDEIVDAVQNRGVTSVALYGFSHGGGSIYDLTERLDANKASIGTFDVLYTAYIDGIENDSDTDLDSETRLPVGTAYHVNYYQRFGFIPPWGNSVSGAGVNVNVTSTGWGFLLVHITITNHINVQNGVHDPLVLLVPR